MERPLFKLKKPFVQRFKPLYRSDKKEKAYLLSNMFCPTSKQMF